MSESANVALVRSIYAVWERGDFSAADWADVNIEFVIADGPSPGRWTGLAGMAEGMREFLIGWEDFRGRADEYRELDDERIFVLTHFSARGKRSGLDVGQMWTAGAHLFHLRDRKVTRLVAYWDRERALADLGMAEEPESQR